MERRIMNLIPFGAVAAAIAGAPALAEGVAPALDRSVAEQIASLENELAAIKASRHADWMTPRREEEIRAIIREVVNDADSRTSLLANGGNAGYGGNGFFITNDDGTFSLNIRAQAQFRAMWNSRDDSGGDNSIFGFENPRTKLIFKGDLFNEDFSYNLSGDFRTNGDFALENAYVKHKFGNGVSIWWGQMKTPFQREELIHSRYSQFTERSYVHEFTGLGRTQGVMLKVMPSELFHAAVMFSDGANIRTDGANLEESNSAFDNDGNEFAFTARAEAILAGEGGFRQFADFTSSPDDKFGWLLGGAVHYQGDEYGPGGADKAKYLQWTVDTQLEFGGANLFGSVVGVHSDADDPMLSDFDQYAVVVQGGYQIDPDKIELIGRWEYLDTDGAIMSYNDEVNLFSAGVNVFFAGHQRKWTTDVVYATDPVPVAISGTGLLRDGVGQDGQLVFRSQYQISF